MSTFKKVLIAVVALAALGATQASAGYYSYGYSYGYGYGYGH
jgi:hypothetical protein